MSAKTCTLAAMCVALLLGCDAALATRLDERQANRIVVALDGEGIAASKAVEQSIGDTHTWEVRVASDDLARALRVLDEASLPSHRDPGLAEVFGEGGLVPTATEERARYVAALAGELSTSIEAIEGVLDARVHVALADQRDFALDAERPRPRASVLIRHKPGPPPYDEASIRALIAGAVQELRIEDVAIIAVQGPEHTETTPSLVRIGPISVTRGSAPTLKAILAGALALHLVLALCLVFVLMRRRQAQTAPEG